jgi:hypothetical protein
MGRIHVQPFLITLDLPKKQYNINTEFLQIKS